jgi:hypothetical protein
MGAERFELYEARMPVAVRASFPEAAEVVVRLEEKMDAPPFYFVRDAETGAVYVLTVTSALQALGNEEPVASRRVDEAPTQELQPWPFRGPADNNVKGEAR